MWGKKQRGKRCNAMCNRMEFLNICKQSSQSIPGLASNNFPLVVQEGQNIWYFKSNTVAVCWSQKKLCHCVIVCITHCVQLARYHWLYNNDKDNHYLKYFTSVQSLAVTLQLIDRLTDCEREKLTVSRCLHSTAVHISSLCIVHQILYIFSPQKYVSGGRTTVAKLQLLCHSITTQSDNLKEQHLLGISGGLSFLMYLPTTPSLITLRYCSFFLGITNWRVMTIGGEFTSCSCWSWDKWTCGR